MIARYWFFAQCDIPWLRGFCWTQQTHGPFIAVSTLAVFQCHVKSHSWRKVESFNQVSHYPSIEDAEHQRCSAHLRLRNTALELGSKIWEYYRGLINVHSWIAGCKHALQCVERCNQPLLWYRSLFIFRQIVVTAY